MPWLQITTAMAGKISVRRTWLSCLPAPVAAPGHFRGILGWGERGKRESHAPTAAGGGCKNTTTFLLQLGKRIT